MKKLLWIGDAVVATGFARCTHHVLNVLKDHWDVTVLGLNYTGDPHPFPYDIYPCWTGGDAFGLGRVTKLVKVLKPDLILIQNDPWNIMEYMRRIPVDVPVAASMPVDGNNCKLGWDLEKLKKDDFPHATLDLGIFWTKWAAEQAWQGGYEGPAAVIPLGVELETYKQMNRAEARQKLGLPAHMWNDDAFIVGNVNRNQPRKRLDLTIQYFAEWIKRENVKDAYLFLHVAPTGDNGYDVKQLKKYYDSERDWLIVVEPPVGHGAPEELMPLVYNSFDVQVSTTQGEGWGLTTMEGMACGIPQIVPDWSALGEWAKDAAYMIPCSTTIATPNNINVIGGVADKNAFIVALTALYTKSRLREQLMHKGLELVNRPEFRWEAIGTRFLEELAVVKKTVPEVLEEGVPA